MKTRVSGLQWVENEGTEPLTRLAFDSGAAFVSSGRITECPEEYDVCWDYLVFEAWFDSAAWTGKEAVR